MRRWIAGLVAGAALTMAAGPALAMSAQVLRDLNVRSGPGTNFRVMGTVRAYTNVEVLGCTPAWCSIAWPGPAFVSAAYLGFNGPPPYVSGPLLVPVVPVVPMSPATPVVITEPNPAVLVAPPPPVYYGPPNKLYVNPPPPLAPTPGYYGAYGIWTW
ncbi:MAG: hypothetical protein B7Y84_06145 [Azorhizobium sp. 32-67-21]|nr:MAG: hypothetical protein B7Z30_03220 [Rhizobiales bacterium 12-68-15]OYX89203.1 MAG: hypothetical protein B7Y84_06145 [Azorhizobium sp. 32-67-21]